MEYFSNAEVEPISTYVDFGEREFLVADERGYEHLLYKMAEDFLFSSGGNILDSRLKLNKVCTNIYYFTHQFCVSISIYCYCNYYFFIVIEKDTIWFF